MPDLEPKLSPCSVCGRECPIPSKGNTDPHKCCSSCTHPSAPREPDFNPYELWNLQEKPHVSDNALNMGPIPGTEGIESDPPPKALPECLLCGWPCDPKGGGDHAYMDGHHHKSCLDVYMASAERRESPLTDPCSPAELWASMIEEQKAERDTLKADVAEMQRKLVKAMRQRNEARADRDCYRDALAIIAGNHTNDPKQVARDAIDARTY